MTCFAFRSFPKKKETTQAKLIPKYDDYLLVPEKRPNALVRLICFPFAGGNAGVFSSKWSSDLPKAVEYVAVQYPGRQTRATEPFITDMKELARKITDSLTPLITKGKPYAFFAHSLGTLVAYETALEIRRRKLPLPEQLILSGRGAPGAIDFGGKPIDCDLPDNDFADLAVSRFGPSPGLIDQRLFSLSLPPLRADMKMYYSYEPELSDTSTENAPEPLEAPLPLPATVIGATGDPLSQSETIETWRAFFGREEAKEKHNDRENADAVTDIDTDSDADASYESESASAPAKKKKPFFFQKIVIDEPVHQYLDRRHFKEELMRCLSSLVVRTMEEEVWC
ncbi:putative Gramicidin S biosynthesis protein grsT [Monocercomonoides exilis]|uniref:putative Gramicidin S biosynthesis protein grsT n=1 Tax=Monocercomonoides exilis TaxID=2049356 RepID=UPI003559A1E7|nr:putative Gramicidin S biosynthesis protein grsT [Monocercomonoides exilis]|eukprot:MONOS_3290.1-p1 / transcript=MONOS_3290.1 / gene=MONOS_3290 / organism=Monocercomonoides_exilis_PA203 / gene_product=Gramicidin S biosynthesis protein grsT / transcript_product=Gramicidin S biosynthesis protein grsT / location=Mono_scaffold00076:73970-75290(-) / protein_length=338 / sequence_SO=supercontig / SO=protein_coding / is_pseudo=false